VTHNNLTLTEPLKIAPTFQSVLIYTAIEKHSGQSVFLQTINLVLAQSKDIMASSAMVQSLPVSIKINKKFETTLNLQSKEGVQ
jgi:hypothetical protein